MLLPDLVPMNPPSDLGQIPFTDVRVASDPAEARRVQEDIEQQLQACPVSDQEIFSVRLALEEALVNAIKHGNQMDRAKAVHISYRFLPDRFEIRITDEGCGFDPADVPRDRFLVAGQAWQMCRQGKADPGAFGILDMYGLWFVAGNVIRDLAALNNKEMLPWDVWGGMAGPQGEVDAPFIDRLAVLSRDPDSHVEALREAYHDTRVAVPDTV